MHRLLQVCIILCNKLENLCFSVAVENPISKLPWTPRDDYNSIPQRWFHTSVISQLVGHHLLSIIPMGTGSSLGCHISNPAPFNVPGKAMEYSLRLWSQMPTGKIWQKLLASHSDQHRSGQCAHWGVNWQMQDVSHLSLSLYVNLSFK